jgi:hypothetical protein
MQSLPNYYTLNIRNGECLNLPIFKYNELEINVKQSHIKIQIAKLHWQNTFKSMLSIKKGITLLDPLIYLDSST